MSFLFGATNANTITKYTGLRVQTSAYGLCVPIVFGTNRVAPNIAGYWDFKAKKQKVGKGGGSSTNYTYQAAVMLALCEGPVVEIPRFWKGDSEYDISHEGWSVFLGGAPQTPWGYLTAQHVEDALSYAGLAYVAASALKLGNSPSLSNYNFEIVSSFRVTGLNDANPAGIVREILENTQYGVGWDTANLASLDLFSDYCLAQGLLLSPAMEQQKSAAEWIKEWCDLANSEIVWEGGVLDIIPRGDSALSGNGATYTPRSVVRDLYPYDIWHEEGSEDPPIRIERARRADAKSVIKIEYLNRDDAYNPDVAEYKDQWAIEQYGEIAGDPEAAHAVCDAAVARRIAQLRSQKQYRLTKYTFALVWRHIDLQLMDEVTLTFPALGLDGVRVLIVEKGEDEDGRLTITAEEVILGSNSVDVYEAETSGGGYSSQPEVEPGDINDPVIFEPPDILADGLSIWAAISGADPDVWGGCEIWASSDGGTSYRKVGRIEESARQGLLAAPLPLHADPDDDSLLSVAMLGDGELGDATENDADRFLTLCRVDEEYLAYGRREVGSTESLGYLRRGLYGSTPAAHETGAPFCRVDELIFKYPYDPALIGVELMFKFISFNLLGNAIQELADVEPYAFTPDGRSASAWRYQLMDEDGSVVMDEDTGSPVFDFERAV